MKYIINFFSVFLLVLCSISCSKKTYQETNFSENSDFIPKDSSSNENTDYPKFTNYRYLALGDSYTIGESVSRSNNFPNQLGKGLGKELNTSVEVNIIASTGWRTDNLLRSLENGTKYNEYDLVTLLIGVNNQYQGISFDRYKKEFPELLSKALALANNNPSKVIVVSIPDYAYTPFGEGFEKEKVSAEIDNYNSFASQTAKNMNVTFVNITDITRQGLAQPELVADDGLHPSAIAYKRFVDRLQPIILNQLKD